MVKQFDAIVVGAGGDHQPFPKNRATILSKLYQALPQRQSAIAPAARRLQILDIP
ncbi:MAG: hypothetical protein AAFO87_05210 [Cyanobacteria bacterium J06607_6]